MGALGQWEWIIIELVVLAAAIYELISVRRLVRKDRAEKAAREAAAKAAEPNN